jgi:hypothetical protein
MSQEGAKTLSTMTLGVMTLSLITVIIMTLRTVTFNIAIKYDTQNNNIGQCYDSDYRFKVHCPEFRYADCPRSV